jgi:flavin-dependent dehydrogenase
MAKKWSKWTPKGKSIFNEILRAEIVVGKKTFNITRDPGTAYILNRQEFIYQLGKDAEKLGVEIQTNDNVKSISDLDGDYIVDASGCPSSIKREIGIDKGIKGFTFQQTIEDPDSFIADKIKIVFDGRFGYFWIFPRDSKKKELNVGLGFSGFFDYNLKELLENFKQENNIQGKVNYTLGGLIPIGLQPPFSYKNILFVGDAGIGTFPFSGQGIYRALLSGDIAGRYIAKGIAEKYSHKVYSTFLRWESFGKLYIYSNYLFRRINPDLVLTSLRYFTRFAEVAHI